jgi:hypothetical protein
LKKRREHGQELLFVDLAKAPDWIHRGILFSVLAKYGVPPHLIRVIKRTNMDLQGGGEAGMSFVADTVSHRHAGLPGVTGESYAGGVESSSLGRTLT